MATSGSVNFDQSATELIKDALILIGGIEIDETPTDEPLQYAMRTLNRMCKAWSNKGLKVWVWKEAELPLEIGQASYTLGPAGDLVINRPLEIANARRLVDSIETPIAIRSRNEYMNQPEKDTSSGEPVYVYYDPQLVRGVLYVWPAPIAEDQINFSYKSYIEDFDTLADTPYFPSEWLEAIVYNLALRLCPMYEVVGQDKQDIVAMAVQFLQEAEDGDMDQGSVYLQPEETY
jgi:hypothetical protein